MVCGDIKRADLWAKLSSFQKVIICIIKSRAETRVKHWRTNNGKSWIKADILIVNGTNLRQYFSAPAD